MSSDESRTDGTTQSTDRTARAPDEPARDELVAELETLRAEAARLRESYARARRAQYRRTAAGFAVLGVLSTAGGVLFPASRTVLLALGGTGLFAAVLTWFVTPERFVSADVGEAVYEALARDHDALAGQLGLTDRRVYVPPDDAATGVRLFVPQRTPFELPPRDALESPLVVEADAAARGLALRPTGETLFAEFEAALDGPLADDPAAVVGQVREALVEQFEIAESVAVDLDAADGRLSVRADGNVYGDLARFDHPVVSTVAVALARGLDRPITVEVSSEDGDALATLRWETEATETDGDDDTDTAAETDDDAETDDAAERADEAS